jgi:arylsulfatase A-like enzyme/tetratricopeptide (TPR) repeat protein
MLWLIACSPAPRPDILLVTLDTTRADALGAYGGGRGVTPALDRLATEGVRFDRAYTVTPLTIPSHSSVMTGLWPPSHGVRDNGDYVLSDDAKTLAEALHDGGYATMASVGAEVTSHHWGFAQGFDAFFDEMGPATGAGEKNRWRVERPADKVVDDAVAWLGQHTGERDAPFFAWVHVYDAHHPYAPPEPQATIFADKPYLGEVAFVDSQVQRLLDAIPAERRARAWFVVAADHGESLGSHGEGMHGVLLYDATTHIPFLVSAPGAVAGSAVDAPVSLVDIAPTVLAAAGLPGLPGAQGLDLGPALRGEAFGADRTVYAESLYALRHYGWAAQRAVVDRDWKLIDSTTPELYARGDRQEADDRLDREPAVRARLTERLGALAAAMPGPAGTSAEAGKDEERTRQLEALGYVTSTIVNASATAGLPDPVQRLPSLRRLEHARAALRGDDAATAETAARELMAEDPGLGAAAMTLAQALARQRRAPEALEVLRELDARQPSSNAKSFIGSLLLATGRAREALEPLEAAVGLDPFQANTRRLWLQALAMSGEDRRLDAESARALADLPDSAPIWGLRGVALAMTHRPDDAAPLLEKSLASDPVQPLLNHALGAIYADRGDPVRAEPLLLEEVRLFPPAPASRRVLVVLYAGQKRYAEQLEQLREISALEPPLADTLHSIAQATYNLGRWAEADAAVDRCTSAFPSYPGCAMLKANTQKKLGHEADAQQWYQRALKLAGRAPLEPRPGFPGEAAELSGGAVP